MKFKILLAAISFIPTMVMAQPHVIAPPSTGIPGSNGGGIAKPAAAPVAVPTMPQGAIPRPIGPMNSGVPQPPSGSAGGNGGLLIGNGGNGRVAKPGIAPLAVKPTPAQPKLAAAPKEEAPVVIAPAPIVENSSSKPHGK